MADVQTSVEEMLLGMLESLTPEESLNGLGIQTSK
jgi:hypothetical protein